VYGGACMDMYVLLFVFWRYNGFGCAEFWFYSMKCVRKKHSLKARILGLIYSGLRFITLTLETRLHTNQYESRGFVFQISYSSCILLFYLKMNKETHTSTLGSKLNLWATPARHYIYKKYTILYTPHPPPSTKHPANPLMRNAIRCLSK